MEASADSVVQKAVQELLFLRKSVDQRLAECLERLQGLSRGAVALLEGEGASGLTTPIERPHKRHREAFESSDGSTPLETQLVNDFPCRVDLSHWAQHFLQECRTHHSDIEARTGKKRKATYVYGNYPSYYRYRLADHNTNDPRIQCFPRTWFERKDCLDIGSHVGILPLGLVTSYAPKSMTGVEIDPVLCAQAHRLRSQLMQKYKEGRKMEIYSRLKQTRFIHGDILGVSDVTGPFDVVTCLSVSKWIHFHHGDTGMQNLFVKFWEVLRENGLLIFEPQPLKSYHQAERKQDMSRVPFPLSQIQFLPDQFLEYLTESVGFRLVETLHQPDAISKGFERPIYVLEKSLTSRQTT